MYKSILPLGFPPPSLPRERKGVVYTKRWVVELILDLAGYTDTTNLVERFAVEPAAGEGAFLVPMVRRLISACRRQGRPLADCAGSLIAYEINETSAGKASAAVVDALKGPEVRGPTLEKLAADWIRVGDYLLDAARLPRADFVIGNPPY